MDFDLVLTDENMPKMKGLQLIRKIHSVSPDMPVLLATGFSNAVDKDVLASENVRVVLRKPYSLFDLATALRGALSQTENK